MSSDVLNQYFQKVDKAENLVKKVKSSKNMAEDVDKANLRWFFECYKLNSLNILLNFQISSIFRLENAVLRWNSIQVFICLDANI